MGLADDTDRVAGEDFLRNVDQLTHASNAGNTFTVPLPEAIVQSVAGSQ